MTTPRETVVTPHLGTASKLEVFFDVSSPWTYLGFEGVIPLAREMGIEPEWRPILVGGVFNSVNPSVYQARENPVPGKAAYSRKDMADWARLYGLKIAHPPSVFPVNSVKAMRGCFVAQREGCLVSYARAAFEAYWGEDRDLSRDDVLGDIVQSVGIDRTEFFEAIAAPETKEALRRTTDELIARGGFGSPTFFVDENDMYFGNDRLLLLRHALERGRS